MEIIKNINDTEITLSLKGRLDSTTASSLEETVKGLDQSFTKVVFDLKELEYVSSAGLRVFIMTHKMFNKVVIANVNSIIYEVLEMTGFADLFEII